MITHIALFAWKPDTKAEHIEHALEEVKKLRGNITGIVDIHCGQNFSKWNKGYTHAVVVTATNRHAMDEYRRHPDHQKIAKVIEEMEADGIGFDFED